VLYSLCGRLEEVSWIRTEFFFKMDLPRVARYYGAFFSLLSSNEIPSFYFISLLIITLSLLPKILYELPSSDSYSCLVLSSPSIFISLTDLRFLMTAPSILLQVKTSNFERRAAGFKFCLTSYTSKDERFKQLLRPCLFIAFFYTVTGIYFYCEANILFLNYTYFTLLLLPA